MIYRLIAPKEFNRPVLEGEFTDAEINSYNALGYNIYYLPNYPRNYEKGVIVTGADIDAFEWVFVDCDLKDEVYKSKDEFLEKLSQADIPPTKIVDSGHGVHAYWRVTGLDAMSYLRFQRRLMHVYNTDKAIGQLFQLMRVPGTVNTKGEPVLCELIYEADTTYTAEELDKLLPPITTADEAYCQQHYNKTHNRNTTVSIDETLPPKFGKLIREHAEVKSIWSGNSTDRSKDDYRLGHLMFANEFTKEEAVRVLVNSAKAMSRAPIHRVNYAQNIVDKIWTYELSEKSPLDLSDSVENILKKPTSVLKGTPLRCHPWVDNTERGYRLGDVIGLVAGSGVGKTAFAMNMFRWFTQSNPDYHHFFIPLEQPAHEIAERWKTMCGTDTALHSKVHVMSNYDDTGNFRHLSLGEIEDYLTRWQTKTKQKIGCVVIDHIGALKKKGSNDENQDLMTICHKMKAFAMRTNTLLIMQSQTSREKAGIGDLELNKDAAYGTLFFEAYCDYLITLWQPLKRTHKEDACPTVTAFKFCKIRHKKAKRDIIKEDEAYYLYFDSDTELLRALNQDEEVSFKFFLPKATNMRKADRKTDLIEYKSVPHKEQDEATTTRH